MSYCERMIEDLSNENEDVSATPSFSNNNVSCSYFECSARHCSLSCSSMKRKRGSLTTTAMMRILVTLTTILIVLLLHTAGVSTSVGDRIDYFRGCVGECYHQNCSTPARVQAFEKRQPFILHWTGWTCYEECKYSCQWNTIDFLLSPSVNLDWKKIPQFYGKWTFPRILGIQEPASCFFSLCNLLATFFAWRIYHARMLDFFGKGVYRDAQFVITTMSAIIAMNAWFWSTIFHVHDFPVTEKMDYFSAGSVVFFNLYCAVVYFMRDVVLSSFPEERRKIEKNSLNNNCLGIENELTNAREGNQSLELMDSLSIKRKDSRVPSSVSSTESPTKSWFSPLNTINLFMPFSFPSIASSSVVKSLKSLLSLSMRLRSYHQPSSRYARKTLHDDVSVRNGKSSENRDEDDSKKTIMSSSSSSTLDGQYFHDQYLPSRFFYFSLGVPFFSFFLYHIHFLNYRFFDYGYNMKVNLIAGITGSILWLIWFYCRSRFRNKLHQESTNFSKKAKNNKSSHLKIGLFCIISLNLSVALEIIDFPPILFSYLDSHALWHLATTPVPFFWFRFLAEEAVTSFQERRRMVHTIKKEKKEE